MTWMPAARISWTSRTAWHCGCRERCMGELVDERYLRFAGATPSTSIFLDGDAPILMAAPGTTSSLGEPGDVARPWVSSSPITTSIPSFLSRWPSEEHLIGLPTPALYRDRPSAGRAGAADHPEKSVRSIFRISHPSLSLGDAIQGKVQHQNVDRGSPIGREIALRVHWTNFLTSASLSPRAPATRRA